MLSAMQQYHSPTVTPSSSFYLFSFFPSPVLAPKFNSQNQLHQRQLKGVLQDPSAALGLLLALLALFQRDGVKLHKYDQPESITILTHSKDNQLYKFCKVNSQAFC